MKLQAVLWSSLWVLASAVSAQADGKVTGDVVDSMGRPVEGVDVTLYYHHSWTGYGNEVSERTRTDQDGKFAFKHELDYEQEAHETYTDYYVVIAKHPDFAIAWSLVMRDKERETVHLKLHEPKSQTFRLTDTDGKPLKGARIWLRYAGNREDVNPSYREQLSVPDDIDLSSGTTDENGQVTIGNLPNTRARFSASLKGYTPELAFRSTTFEGVANGRLKREVTASGIVRLASGRPLPGAVVWFEPTWIVGYVRYTKSDAEGRFEVDGLFRRDSRGNDARYRVKLRHARFAAREQLVEITDDVPLQDVTLDAVQGTLVRGKVLEPDTDQPLPGARIQGRTASGSLNAYANDRGEFSWLVVPGPANFMFSSPPAGVYVRSGGSGATAKSVNVQGEQVELVLYAPSKVLPLADLTGKLVLPDGSPVAGVPLHAVPTHSFDSAGRISYIPSTATNQDGSFLLDAVPTGTAIGLYAETKDRKHAFGRVIQLAEGQATLDEPIVLHPTHAAKIVIRDDKGPLVEKALKIRPIMGSRWPLTYDRSVRTDKQGRITAGGLVPGLKYFVRDAKANLSDRSWSEKFHTEVVLVPEGE